MPRDSQTLPSEVGPDIEMIKEIRRPTPIINGQIAGVSISPDFIEIPSTSHGSIARRLNFHIHFNENVVELTIPETASISKLTFFSIIKTVNIF